MNKRMILIVAVIGLVTFSAAVHAGLKAYGYGVKATVTSTATRTNLGNDYVRELSCYNSGTNDIYVGINCSLVQFTNLVYTTNAILIPAGLAFQFDLKDQQAKIKSFCYQTESAAQTSVTYFAGY